MSLNEKRQKYRQACEKVIREKLSVSVCPVRFNNVGLPRSGKTSFWRRMMGEILNIMMARKNGEKEQPSTGIAEGRQVIIRSMRSDVGAISSKVWSVVKTPLEEANMLNQFFHQVVFGKSASGLLDCETLASLNDNAPPDASSFPQSSGDLTTDQELKEVLSIIEEAMKDEKWDKVKYLLEDTILLISTDAGGQAEFLDLHASLVQGPSINLLFSRLVDQIDSLFKIYFTNDEGLSTDKEDSTMTVEEVLFQLIASVSCFGDSFSAASNSLSCTPSSCSKSKVIFVGTHLDKVSKEELKMKDAILQKKIRSTEFFDKDIIEFASEDQMLLAVNNLSGGQEEIERIRKFLEKVIERNFEKITIPAAWLIFSLYIRSMKLRTISLKECENLAAKLQINAEELQNALWFLHHTVGVLLYYPELEALKDTVICDMQVVFDSANRLIKNTFTFDEVGKKVSETFRDKAQFSLQDVKKATSEYTDSLLPLEKLVKLLEHLSVLTPIAASSNRQNCTYFMPCVLKCARVSELSVLTTSTDPASLLLRYDCGYVPVGVFPSMITNLVSQKLEGWEMIEDGLRKNKVQFLVGEDYDTLTLISHPQYFEFVVSRSKCFQTPTRFLCAQIRSVIVSTLKTVTSRMNYKFNMQYKFGFQCPVHPGRDHLCILAKERGRFMECWENPQRKRPILLQPHHAVWFEEVNR